MKWTKLLAVAGEVVYYSTIDNDQWAISSYNFKIGDNKIKLRELQNKQLELEKERNQVTN